MPAVIRQGDPNAAGGIALQGSPNVRVNGRPVITVTSKVSPHPCCGGKGCGKHCNAEINRGSGSVRVNGKPVAYSGTTDTCGHNRSQGSPNVFVGG